MNDIKYINSLTKNAYRIGAQKYHELFCNEMNEKEYDRNLLDIFSDMLKPASIVCDAGCGPSGHIGRYLLDKGHIIHGVDISEKCVEIAAGYNPGLIYHCADIAAMPFEDEYLDGIISYYSIVDTPKNYVTKIFDEFNRVLKPGGMLLTAVKEGNTEGIINNFLGLDAEIYFTLFANDEMKKYYEDAGFRIVFNEVRNPYDFEINNNRIFTIGKK